MKKLLHKSFYPLFSVIPLILVGCSIFSTPKVENIRLDIVGDNNWILTNGGDELSVYRSRYQRNKNYVFATAVKECGKEGVNLNPGSIRKLLVGFRNINIKKQLPLNIGTNTGIETNATAVLDETPLQITVYSLKDSSCTVDFVVWSSFPVEEDINSSFTSQSEEFRALVKHYFDSRNKSLDNHAKLDRWSW